MGADKIRLAKENVESFSSGDWDLFKSQYNPEGVYDEVATQRRIVGPDAIVEVGKGWRKAFPDAKGTVTRAIESGDTVAMEVVWEGTQTGPLESPQGTIPPSGKRIRMPAALLVSFKNDKIAENKHYFDLMTMLAQIGAIPTPATA
jgi:steroid delta-isomerase-like uncharacterized protein